MNEKRQRHAAVEVKGDILYVFGGVDTEHLNSIEMYTRQSWTTIMTEVKFSPRKDMGVVEIG